MSTVTRSNPTATVIDTRPGEVRVRLNDNAELPRWYPSILEDTALGSFGTMLRANQEQMLFIPHGFDIPPGIDAYTKDEVDALIVASGSFPGFGGTGSAPTVAHSDHNHNATYAPLAHATDTANPHAVTKAQVGLGSVDNTSDADKPVSTATTAAIADFETTTELNARDTDNRMRANHTGNQAISTVTNLQEILDGKPIVIDVGNRSTAIGHDATASGASSFAAGDTATATGISGVAVGNDAMSSADDALAFGTDASATGLRSLAVGTRAAATGTDALAVGTDAEAAMWGTALGINAHADATGAVATGAGAQAHGDYAMATGYGASVPADSPRSWAHGFMAEVPATTPDRGLLTGRRVDVKRYVYDTVGVTELALQDTTGTLHTIGVNEAGLTFDGVEVGKVLTFSDNGSPAAESTVGVGTYATGTVLRTETLQSIFPAITAGLWDVDVIASAIAYRSVATGGIWLWIGNGTTSYHQALSRFSPQTHAHTLNVYISPNKGTTNLTPTSVIDLRYTGFSTAGTTNVINHGWQITARRVG